MAIRIGLADDHQLVRKGIRALLEGFDDFIVITEAANGIELIHLLDTQPELPEIILLDVNMPALNGFETAKRISYSHPQIKIIALSVSDEIKIIREMIRAGACAYLIKDSSPEMFLNVILQVNENGFYYDKNVIESLVEKENNSRSLKIRHDNYKLSLQLESLTFREIEFIQNCCSELTYKEIANKMQVAIRTVDGYRDSVFGKLEVKSRTGLVIFAIQHELAII